MNGTRWQRLKSLYDSAMDLSTRDRRAYLARLPRGSLASGLRRLLDRERDLSGFLEGHPIDPVVEPHPEQHALNPGDVLDNRYEIQDFIGSGGMGEVYRAWDREMQLSVALKTLRPELASQPLLISRLRKEVQLARRVTHTNICRLYDMGRGGTGEGEVLFFTMELLDGRTLTQALRDSLPFETAAQIARQIISGLSAAHASAIIHRDLKSGNVILTTDASGTVRAIITDFGLARDLQAPVSETASVFGANAIAGTPAYMSPEQLEGRAITTASDIYSLGVVLFEMISGRLPIESRSPLVIALRRIREPAPDVRKCAPDAPAAWANAIRACLERDPARRPKSAVEVGLMLSGETPAGRRLSRRVILATVAGGAAAAAAVPILLNIRPKSIAPEARRHFELGQEFAKRRTKANLANAVGEYERSVQIEPAYADAWSGLADAYSAMANFGFVQPREGLDKARSAAARAVQLSPGSGRANGALAYVTSIDVQRWLTAGPHFERAVALNPRDPLVRLWYGSWLGKTRQPAAAMAQLSAGIEQDPASFVLHHQRAVEFFWEKRFAEFLSEAREVSRIQPYEASSYLILARALEWNGQLQEAFSNCQEAEKYGNTPTAMCGRGCVEAASGNLREAERLASQVRQYWTGNPFETVLLAQLLSRLTGPQEVLAILETGYVRNDSTILAAPVSPYLEKWSRDPGFLAFHRKLELPA